MDRSMDSRPASGKRRRVDAGGPSRRPPEHVHGQPLRSRVLTGVLTRQMVHVSPITGGCRRGVWARLRRRYGAPPKLVPVGDRSAPLRHARAMRRGPAPRSARGRRRVKLAVTASHVTALTRHRPDEVACPGWRSSPAVPRATALSSGSCTSRTRRVVAGRSPACRSQSPRWHRRSGLRSLSPIRRWSLGRTPMPASRPEPGP